MLEELRVRFESLEGDIEADRSVPEDKSRRAASLKKQCQLAEESISKMKSRDEAEGEFVQNMVSGRHHRRGVGEWGEIHGSGGKYL